MKEHTSTIDALNKLARQEINKNVNFCWKEYDRLKDQDTEVAEKWKAKAFELLGELPENKVYLKDIQ